MLVKKNELKKRIRKRLPMLTKKQVDYYFNSIIEILVDRFLKNQTIIIDNFGVLSRKKSKPRKVVNISNGEHQEIISSTVCLRPNHAFLAFFRDKKNRAKIRKKIIDASKKAFDYKKKNLI